MKPDLVRSWSETLTRMPTIVVYSNLADSARRASHLGAEAVEKDAQDFTGVLESVLSSGSGARVGANEWLIAIPENPTETVQKIVEAYARTQPYDAGWRCRAKLGRLTRESVELVTTTIRRAARFVGSSVASATEVPELATRLSDASSGMPVNRYLALYEATALPSEKWVCVESYPRAYYCPFCEATEFEWAEGGSGVYDATGTCRCCHADIDVRDAGKLR